MRLLKLLAAGGCVFSATAAAQPDSDKAIPPDIKTAVAQCEATDKPTRIGGLVCLNGRIYRPPVEKLLKDKKPIKILVADTAGGDTKAARMLGERARDDGAKVVINGLCLSSCANYIVPGGKLSLWVLPNSVIALHGSPPRDVFGYADMQLMASGMTKAELARHMDLF